MLRNAILHLSGKLGFRPVIGLELEFYVSGVEKNTLDSLFSEINYNIEKEKGEFQYELRITHSEDIEQVVSTLTESKKVIQDAIHSLGGRVDFSAKPRIDMAGSALHVHVNLIDKNCHKNLFSIKDSKVSDALLYCLGGLCAFMRKDMMFFAPHKSSYLRYIHADSNTPTTVSWGYNNRTAALRIPNITLAPEKCRIEHRVPGADCNCNHVITAILLGIIHGIESKTLPPKKTFGIASDPQYGLKKLPLSLEEAKKCSKSFPN